MTYVGLRAADTMVIANAVTADAALCAVPPTYTIAIAEDGANVGVERVFLDYVNGPFAVGSTLAGTPTPGVTVTLGAGSSLVGRDVRRARQGQRGLRRGPLRAVSDQRMSSMLTPSRFA